MDLEDSISPAVANFESNLSMENNFSFVELLNRVAHDAEKRIPSCSDINDQRVIDGEQVNTFFGMSNQDQTFGDLTNPCDVSAQQDSFYNENSFEQTEEEAEVCLNLSESRSINTAARDFVQSESVDSGSHSQTFNNVSRSFSTFSKLDEDAECADVSSKPKELCGGVIEESMRKYCDDKKTIMFKPELGMEFSSLEEAYQFYNMYSWVAGFSIRLGDNYTNKQKKRTMQEYRCQREGKDKDTKNSTTRCGCKAMIRVCINDNLKWYVRTFQSVHNHEMVESCGEKKHLASHRQIDKHTKEMIRHLRENNVSLTRVNLVMGSFFGSMDKVPFSKKTLRTVCSNIAKEALQDDVRKTLESFRDKIAGDPKFVFTAQLDEDNRLISLMWTSGRSRSLYKHFGDVVTFDTTYETNIYKMPFGMFVGVNNHFQSVIFAGVLLTNERSDDFKWAFLEFVAMMGGKAPDTILTDQSQAMTIAIKENLLSTKHRWCKWHILRKAQEALGHVHKKHKTFSDDFNKVVNHMLTPEEFESGWKYLTKKYDLDDNPFMTRAFEVRDKWAKPYFNEVFCARMTSTQRSESANHVLKVYVPCKSSINMFVKQYTKLIDDREKADDEAEKNRSQKTSKPHFGYPIEKHASRIYTPAVFKLFKSEMRKTSSYVIVSNSEGVSYELEHVDAESRDAWSRVAFRVNVDCTLGCYKCQCRLYEHFGIICCHIMLVLIQTGVKEIPESHIMKRWTIRAREGSRGQNHVLQNSTDCEASRTLRHKKLYMAVLDVVSAGEYDDSTCELAIKYVEIAKKKIVEYKATITRTCQVGYNLLDGSNISKAGEVDNQAESVGTASCGLQIFDREKNYGIDVSSIKAPIIKQKMGRPTNKRYLSHFDSNINRSKSAVHSKAKNGPAGGRTGVHQSRFCSCCRSPTHDIRTCPQKTDDNDQPAKKKKKSTAVDFKF